MDNAVGIGLFVQSQGLDAEVHRPSNLVVPERGAWRFFLAREDSQANLGARVPQSITQVSPLSVHGPHHVAGIGKARAKRSNHHLAKDERMSACRSDRDRRQRAFGLQAAVGNRRLRWSNGTSLRGSWHHWVPARRSLAIASRTTCGECSLIK